MNELEEQVRGCFVKFVVYWFQGLFILIAIGFVIFFVLKALAWIGLSFF